MVRFPCIFTVRILRFWRYPLFGLPSSNNFTPSPRQGLILTHKWGRWAQGALRQIPIPLLTSPLKGEEHSGFPSLQGEGPGGGGGIGSQCEMMGLRKISVFTG